LGRSRLHAILFEPSNVDAFEAELKARIAG
jgi:hypothetical protein